MRRSTLGWLVLLSSCAGGPSPTMPYPQCLTLTEPGSNSEGVATVLRRYQVVLTDSVLSTEPDTFRVAAVLEGGGRIPARWRMPTPDSLVLELAIRPAGKSYLLRSYGDGWTGRANYQTSEMVRLPDGTLEYGVIVSIVEAQRSPCRGR